MRNYIAAVFRDKIKAYEGLHGLWELDQLGDITVHGTTVVHRDAFGEIQVDTKETHPALATAVGVGVGALLGLFAGPVGIAVGVAAGAGLGAAVGGIVGVLADLGRAATRDNALADASFVLGIGESAVIADVTEDWTSPIDTLTRKLDGSVFRRPKSLVRNDVPYSYDNCFYPYEYLPTKNTMY